MCGCSSVLINTGHSEIEEVASEEARLASSVITPLTDELIMCVRACVPPRNSF